jgi:beta-galactosidase
MQARVGASRALMRGNVPWEHVTPSDIEAGLAPRYKVIYLPAQIALTAGLLARLEEYTRGGGRVVLDMPGGLYDEHGLTLGTAEGTPFERLFGAELSDVQYSNNVPWVLEGEKMQGFVGELRPTRAEVLARFESGEPAVTEHRLGRGRAVVLAWDASHAVFQPGHPAREARLRRFAMGALESPYACDGAVVYRLAAPRADHYFFINDGPAAKVRLDTKKYRYRAAGDPVSGQSLKLGEPVELEAHSGRWLRLERE